jgi:hypothetical protein
MVARATAARGLHVRADVACREVEGEWYVLTADGAFHAVTDAVGSTVMKAVVATPGVALRTLVARVRRDFATSGEDVEDDLRRFVAELVDKGIFEER